MPSIQQPKPSPPPASNRLARLQAWLTRRPVLIATGFYLALTLLLFGDVLLSPTAVLSYMGTDIWKGELSGRIMALPELRRGHLMLWNPYLFCGLPFYTQSQSPLLYPGEWLSMWSSASRSINQTLALHTFLAGLFFFLWMRGRGLRMAASLTGGVIFMLSGPFYLHIYNGQLNNITTMAWSPLMFLAIDRILDSRSASAIRRGVLLGTFSLAMQVYASQPQCTFFTLIALTVYLVLRLPRTEGRLPKVTACAAAGLWAFAIGALALAPAVIQSGESIRSGTGVGIGFASSFSLPPLNLLTCAVPGLLGDRLTFYYIGRWYFWETSIYIGATGTALAIYGACCGRHPGRRTAIAMTGILLLLALGGYTPLFPFLYHYIPGFHMLRGMSKFAFPAALFMAQLVAIGIDTLQTKPLRLTGAAAATAAGGAALLAIALLVTASATQGPGGAVGRYLHTLAASGTSRMTIPVAADPAYIKQFAACSSQQFWIAGLLLLATAAAFRYARTDRHRAYGLAGLAIAQSVLFAAAYRPTFDRRDLVPRALASSAARVAPDDRVIVHENGNVVLALPLANVDGYDSYRLQRSAEFMAYSQGSKPDDFSAIMSPTPLAISPMFRMLRLRWIPGDKGGLTPLAGLPALPHVLLVDRCRVLQGRDRILAELRRPDFDPARTVILEQTPDVPIASSDTSQTGTESPLPAGTARITAQTSDSLDISADVTRPCVLLVTDAYSKYWAVTEHRGDAQSRYQVLPADYMLRGVPLAPGHHEIRLQYVAPAWKISEAVTFVSLAAFFLALLPWRRAHP